MSFRLCGTAAPAAVFFFIAAIPLFPQNFYTNDIQSAYRLYARGEFHEAAEMIEGLRDKGRLNASGFALLGMCYMNTDNLAAAEETIEIASLLDSRDYLVLLARGNLYLVRQEYPRAEDAFEKARSAYPGRPEAPRGLAAAIVGKALGKMRSGNFEAAADELSRALNYQPNNPEILSRRIAALRQTDRRAELEEAYRTFLQLRPSSPDAHAGLGILLHSAGKTDAARKHLQRAVELDCTDPEPFLILGREAVKTGSNREARGLIQEAVGKAVQLFNMYRMEAAREMQAAQERESAREKQEASDIQGADTQEPEMLAHLEALSRQSERPQQLLEESLSHLTQLYSDPEQLIEDLRRLADWYSSSPEVQTVLAQQLMEAGYVEQAREEWQTLSDRVPFYYKAHLGLAGCYREAGKLVKAALSARRALDLAPDEPKVYRELRGIYHKMGKPEVYLQVLEMQLLKDKYNPLLRRRAAEAAEELGKTKTAEQYRALDH